MFSIMKLVKNLQDIQCSGTTQAVVLHNAHKKLLDGKDFSFEKLRNNVVDPIDNYYNVMRKFLFGDKDKSNGSFFFPRILRLWNELPVMVFPKGYSMGVFKKDDANTEIEGGIEKLKLPADVNFGDLRQYPSGKVMRAELFQNKMGVHLPIPEFIQQGQCYLQETSDYMQTAVNAFAIFLEGNLDDVLRLPADYVLRSARTIAMMKIAREKLAATWTVVRGDSLTEEMPYNVLEMYRPLFKYLNGREIARLNLSDPRILSYIGTHAELDRHQVGVVAGRYIKMNPHWSEPKYMNLMNNLLCGVPMTFMRRIPENTYLQLTHQVFYHVRACDPLQRRFYLTMMTRTQALGKSYSWSARDVSRLGLLLSEVEGPDLAAVNPEAMSGITAQVMLEIPPSSLRHITEMQLRYIGQKPLNILAKRLRTYQDQLQIFSKANPFFVNSIPVAFVACVVLAIKYI